MSRFGIIKEQTPQSDQAVAVIEEIRSHLQVIEPRISDLSPAGLSGINPTELLAEYDELIRTMMLVNNFPPGQEEVYNRRLHEVQGCLSGLLRIAKALHLGYEPYTIPNNFFVGVINHLEGKQSAIRLQFMAPMPEGVLEKYKKAQKSKLFDKLVVASPRESDFRVISSLFADPVLVGYMPINIREGVDLSQIKDYEIVKGVKVKNGVGFLITHWDLSRDLKAGGII